MRAYRSVVIGAGPAGLSAAAELSQVGSCLLLDGGPAANVRDRARDLLAGVGGAGLFSDGKHSFYPSATALWRLPDRAALEAAFGATAALLGEFAVDAGALPNADEPPSSAAAPLAWQPKRYPSIYVPLVDRFALIERLVNAADDVLLHTHVVDARRDAGGIVLTLDVDGRSETIHAEHVVVAGGRWAPRLSRPWLASLGVSFAFLRAEVGVRIELPADAPLFTALPGVDGKLRFVDRDAQLELRTFCTCRRGEVVLGEQGGIRAWSGRADGPPTARSNVGLLVRSFDPQRGRAMVERTVNAPPLSRSLAAFRSGGATSDLTSIFGGDGAAWLSAAWQRLVSFSPSLATIDGRLFAPALEGVGDYPCDDGHLAIAPGVWVAGDAAGRFRGIVAAMVSGRYVARRIATEMCRGSR